MPHAEEKAITRQTLSGLLWMLWGKGAYAVLQLLVLVILARLLSPADFGVVNAAMIVVGFSAIFSRLGLGPAVVQRPELEPRHLQTAVALSLGFGILIAGLIWASAPAVAAFFRMEALTSVLRVLSLTFPLKGIAVLAESLLLRELRFRRLANLEVASYAVGYGLVGVALAVYGLGIWALVAAQVTQALTRTLALLWMRPLPRHVWPEARAARELMFFGGGFTVAKVANYFALQGDNFVVGRWLGPAALGLYGRAYQLMAMPSKLIGEALDDVLFPTLARVQHDIERLGRAYTRGIAAIALATLPASAVVVILAPDLVRVVLGEQWMEAVLPFQVLAVSMLFRTSYKMSDAVSRATGAVYRRAWRQVVYALLVVAGAWVGQHRGIPGVALGVSLAVLTNYLLMAQLALAVAGLRWRTFLAAHAPAALLAGAAALITLGISSVSRAQGLGGAPLLVITLGSVLLLGTALVAGLPRLFLGSDGIWMRQEVLAYVQRLRRAGRTLNAEHV